MSARWLAALLAAAIAAPAVAEEAASATTVAQADQQQPDQSQTRKRGLVRRKAAPPPVSQPAPPEKPAAGTPAAETSGAKAPGTAAPTVEAPAAVKHDMSPDAKSATFDRKLFKPDPSYASHAYDAAAQHQVYGGKQRLSAPRPLLELGYPMYDEGALGDTHEWLGAKNPVRNQFLVFGDWRVAAADNRFDVPLNAKGDKAHDLVATRLNLDFDWRLTSTERFHVLMRPLDRNGDFTRYEWKGAPTADGKHSVAQVNGNVVTGFFEGDLGAMAAGMSGRYNGLDLPFTAGLIPLFFQNGVWLDDAFTGFAATLPAMNSRRLDISNYDITFFAGFDKVSSPVFGKDDHSAKTAGITTFIERHGGYLESGYGYVLDTADTSLLVPQKRSFHDATVAYTRRYGGWLSNSVRIVGSFGQEAQPTNATKANGAVLLIENSLITSHEATLVPYFNLFWGVDHPQSLARDPGAGGILKNTGINFETDGLTGFPTLDATATGAAGGALGLEYLFALDQQLVLEGAGLERTHEAPTEPAVGGKKTSDYGVGLRYQIPFWKRFIVRADAMGGVINAGSANPKHTPGGEQTISGIRLELRMKF